MAIGDKKSAVMQSDIVNDFTTGGSTNVLSAEMGKTLAQRPNPNLLKNWYFVNPVDQRGGYVVMPGTQYYDDTWTAVGITTGYVKVDEIVPTGGAWITIDGVKRIVAHPSDNVVRGYVGAGYGIDGWTGGENKTILIEDGFITIKQGSAWLGTFIDAGNVNHWLNKTYTLSVLLADGSLHYGTVTPTENSGVYTAFDVNGGNVYLQFGWGTDKFLFCLNNIATNGDISPIAAKLELGTVQTIAHQENDVWVLNEIPNYAEQLLRCSQSTADANDAYANGKTGFAPAGYGLGSEATTSVTPETIDSTKGTGVYAFAGFGSNYGGVAFNYAKLIVTNHNSSSVEQTIVPVNTGIRITRYCNANVWQDWCVENPPMGLGVEYRTTERYLGKPVYTMVVDFGALPVDTYKIVAHNIANVDCMLSVYGVIPERGTQIPGKSVVNGYWNNDVDVLSDRNNMQIVTRNCNDGLKNEGWTARITLRYTKTTD